MLDAEAVSEIRRLHYAERWWKVGTIAAQLGVHPDAVRGALNRPSGPLPPRQPRSRITDPYLPFVRETLERYPRLRSTVLYRMLRERGFAGSVVQLRRVVRQLRPSRQREVFTRLRALPGEAGQVDWADFGEVTLGRAQRRLSAFVLTLSYSRLLYVEFFFDQSLGSFLRGHVNAFEHFGGVPRVIQTGQPSARSCSNVAASRFASTRAISSWLDTTASKRAPVTSPVATKREGSSAPSASCGSLSLPLKASRLWRL